MNIRRKLLVALGAGVGAAPLASLAQQQGKIWRIGFLYTGSRQSALETGRYPAFLDGMRKLGYIEGKHFVLEERFGAGGSNERLRVLGSEILQANPDVIVTSGATTTHALLPAAKDIPIVIVVTFDPVREGFAASLARPGRNVTGLSSMLDDVFAKHVELLKLAVPRLSRIAALAIPGDADHPPVLKRIEGAAQKLGMQVLRVDVDALKGFEPAFRTIARERAEALIVLGSAYFVQHFRDIAALAIKNRVASIYSGREYPDAGGLMSYGPNFADNYRRAATYVDKILKGAKPSDLPIEQPTKFELVVNRKTANALGITFSQELLFRTDQVIE